MGYCNFLPFLVLTTLSFMFTSPCFSYVNANIDLTKFENSSSKNQKVNLNIYYGSRCPQCAGFIVNPALNNIFDTDLGSIVNLRLVPWGNALLLDSKQPICQHGETECYLNKVEACAIKAWPETMKHFKFVRCIALKQPVIRLSNKEMVWRQCASELGLNAEPIQSCLASGEGLQLLLKYGEETMSLIPPLKGLPWATVNNIPLGRNYADFVKSVCQAYLGKLKPKACKFHLEVSTYEKEIKFSRSNLLF